MPVGRRKAFDKDTHMHANRGDTKHSYYHRPNQAPHCLLTCRARCRRRHQYLCNTRGILATTWQPGRKQAAIEDITPALPAHTLLPLATARSGTATAGRRCSRIPTKNNAPITAHMPSIHSSARALPLNTGLARSASAPTARLWTSLRASEMTAEGAGR
jgi:hypothetical protein